MDEELRDLSVHRSGEPRRGRHRAFLVFATTVAAGLGTAGPALATELPAPPPMPEIEFAVPEPPEPSLPMPAVPDIDLEPVVETQVDAGNIDVSVRVLSPGEDEGVTQEGAADVVSPAPAPDITPAADPANPATSEDASPASGTNTNVSIRVLSPGDRGEVTQLAGQIAGGSGGEVVEAGPDSALPQPDPAPASTAPSDDLPDSSQYQSDNSRYQSDATTTTESWNWLWVLSLDCTGDVSSISTETGHQESLVWSWEWDWEWGCSGADAAESSAESGGRAPPPAEAAPPTEATATESEGAVAEPWVWSWTFTFCGETRTITTRAGLGTPLTWTWDWTWTWTCPTAAAPDVQPPPAIDTSPPLVTAPPATSGTGDSEEAQRTLQTSDGPTATTLPTVWFPTLPFGTELGAPIQAVVPAMPVPGINVEIELEVPISPVVLPASTAPSLTSPVSPFPAVDVAAEPTTVSPATLPAPGATIVRHARRPATRVGYSPTETQGSQHSQPRAHHARPVKQTRAHGARSKRDPQQLPLERQSRQGLGSSSAGGVIPSALLFGFAALTGFIILAAPGLGRRIRVARELSPRSPDQSPIDHPG